LSKSIAPARQGAVVGGWNAECCKSCGGDPSIFQASGAKLPIHHGPINDKSYLAGILALTGSPNAYSTVFYRFE
jgi:hypothetical protein